MNITANRFTSDDDATISQVYVDGQFFCFGLEDEKRQVKVPGETRIPAGAYKVGLRTAGSISPKYAAQFPDLHQGMLHLLDVVNFDWIYIHIGNTAAHTAGCLLVGYGVNVAGKYRLANSTDAYEDLYRRVVGAAAGGDLVIDFIDNDRGTA